LLLTIGMAGAVPVAASAAGPAVTTSDEMPAAATVEAISGRSVKSDRRTAAHQGARTSAPVTRPTTSSSALTDDVWKGPPLWRGPPNARP
jgi:hypothetical protein